MRAVGRLVALSVSSLRGNPMSRWTLLLLVVATQATGCRHIAEAIYCPRKDDCPPMCPPETKRHQPCPAPCPQEPAEAPPCLRPPKVVVSPPIVEVREAPPVEIKLPPAQVTLQPPAPPVAAPVAPPMVPAQPIAQPVAPPIAQPAVSRPGRSDGPGRAVAAWVRPRFCPDSVSHFPAHRRSRGSGRASLRRRSARLRSTGREARSTRARSLSPSTPNRSLSRSLSPCTCSRLRPRLHRWPLRPLRRPSVTRGSGALPAGGRSGDDPPTRHRTAGRSADGGTDGSAGRAGGGSDGLRGGVDRSQDRGRVLPSGRGAEGRP